MGIGYVTTMYRECRELLITPSKSMVVIATGGMIWKNTDTINQYLIDTMELDGRQ